MAYPPHDHQPPMPPEGPNQGPPHSYPAPHPGQPLYGNQPPYPGQQPHPGHAFPAPGQYNPQVMPPPSQHSKGSVGAVAIILSIGLVLILFGGGAAFFLFSDSSSSTNAVTDDSPDLADVPERTEHEARFSIGNGSDDAPEVVIFADYNCGGCHAFDYEYGESLRAAALNGEIRLDIVTVNLTGTATDPDDYSSQAAAAAACVYEAAPDDFGDFHGDLMQASYNTSEHAIPLDDVTSLAFTFGPDGDVHDCFEGAEKADHADISTSYATSNNVASIPTVWVNEVVTPAEDVLDAIAD